MELQEGFSDLRKKISKIHYNMHCGVSEHPNSIFIARKMACGIWHSPSAINPIKKRKWLEFTKDARKVTCKNCLKVLSKNKY